MYGNAFLEAMRSLMEEEREKAIGNLRDGHYETASMYCTGLVAKQRLVNALEDMLTEQGVIDGVLVGRKFAFAGKEVTITDAVRDRYGNLQLLGDDGAWYGFLSLTTA